MAATRTGSILASLGFGTLAFLMVGLTVAITWSFGHTLALTPWEQTIQALASVSVDLMGFMLAFAIGLLLRWRRYVGAVLFCVPLMLYVGYSMQSVIGFGSVARIAKDKKITAEVNADKQSTQETNALLAQAKQDTLEWMRSTAYRRANKRDERGTLLKEIQQEASKPVEFKTAKSEGVVGDPQAEQLASLMSGWGVTPSTIQMGQVIWLAVLLVMGKALGSFCTGYFWPTGGGTRRVVDRAPLFEGNIATQTAPPRVVRDNTKNIAAEAVDEQLVAQVSSDVEEEAAWWRQVERFRKEATYLDPDANKTSTDLYQHFSRWARRAGVPEPLMSHNRFGRISTAMQAQMGNSDMKRAWYTGVALIPLSDESEAVSLAKVA